MNPVVKLAAIAQPGEKKFILFAGAGVSKDAGIPTAWDLMLKTAGLIYASENATIDTNIDLERWFIGSGYANMTYSQLISLIYPNYPDQQRFLQEYLTAHQIGEAHRAIGELARRGVIRAIVTTNFDHFIEKALEEKGLDTQVISNDEDLRYSEPLIHCKAVRIYKPHGTLGRGALKNTPKDLETLSPLMEEELVRVLSEHGVIVLGYSGQDKGIQKVFEKRSSNYYPLFWVDPCEPEGDMRGILENKAYTYIKCEGASQFIGDYFKLLERIELLAPKAGKGPSIPDLQYAISIPSQPVVPLFKEFLNNLIADLEMTRPDFSKFSDYDDAIVDQIVKGIVLTYRFIGGALIAAKAKHEEAISTLYHFFGDVLKLYNAPEASSGAYHEEDFDGFRFLGYEMFVGLVTSLLRYGHWKSLGDILFEDLFVEKKYDSKYVSFVRLSAYTRSLNVFRNNRLNLQRINVMGDMLKDRFTNSQLSEFVSHKEFLEGDYFLFMRTVCHEKKETLEIPQYLRNVWAPWSCVCLDRPPSYVLKAQSRKFLEEMIPATGFSNADEFIENFKQKNNVFTRYFIGGFKENPIEYFDVNKLGTLK